MPGAGQKAGGPSAKQRRRVYKRLGGDIHLVYSGRGVLRVEQRVTGSWNEISDILAELNGIEQGIDGCVNVINSSKLLIVHEYLCTFWAFAAGAAKNKLCFMPQDFPPDGPAAYDRPEERKALLMT